MTPNEITELIGQVEAGREVRLIMPGGYVKVLGEHDLDDLYIARRVSELLEDAAAKLAGGGEAEAS